MSASASVTKVDLSEKKKLRHISKTLAAKDSWRTGTPGRMNREMFTWYRQNWNQGGVLPSPDQPMTRGSTANRIRGFHQDQPKKFTPFIQQSHTGCFLERLNNTQNLNVRQQTTTIFTINRHTKRKKPRRFGEDMPRIQHQLDTNPPSRRENTVLSQKFQ